MLQPDENDPLPPDSLLAFRNFTEYLRINSARPNVNYDSCVEFLERQAESLDLPVLVFRTTTGKPMVLITWTGTELGLPGILFTSQMDVAPVCAIEWGHNPFAAEVANGRIYARGSQDSKSVGIQYIEAIRRMKTLRITLKRTIYLLFMPAENFDGHDGMGGFVQTEDFVGLNVGYVLCPGEASPHPEFVVFTGERCVWNMDVHCQGDPSHGSFLNENTAGEIVTRVLHKCFAYRTKQKNKLIAQPNWTIGNVVTINLTKIEGGDETYMVPKEFVLSFECRIPPERQQAVELEEEMAQWEELSDTIRVQYTVKEPQIPLASPDDIYWISLIEAAHVLKIQVKPQIFGGPTHRRHLHKAGVPVIGFSPINNTPMLSHIADEYLEIQTFLRGITIYYEIFYALGFA